MYPTEHLSDSDKHIEDNNEKIVRSYQLWKGNNIFLLGGRLIFGPDVKSLFLTLFLILAPTILFCAFVSQELIQKFPHRLGITIMTICIVLATYVVILLLITSGTDPGIIPRNVHPPDPDDYDGSISSISTDWAGSISGPSNLPATKMVIVNRKAVKVKYCRTCMLYRPPRCSHCSVCNNCVERFDHHCPWVGQCIGQRNYRYFFMFVSSTTLLCFYVFVFCFVNIAMISTQNHCDMWTAAILESPISGLLIVYTFLVAWFVGGLTTFHLYLICTNQTTYENFRYGYDSMNNPYNIGCTNNVQEVLLSRVPKSKHNFRAQMIVDSSFFSNEPHLEHTMSSETQNTSFDFEVIRKRQGLNLDDTTDIRTNLVNGQLERCETRSSNSSWVHHRGDWDAINQDPSSDVHILQIEFEQKAHDK